MIRGLTCVGILALGAALIADVQTVTYGQTTYPTRLIEFITPYPPGGISDTSFRVIQPALTKELGVSLVNINKSGAGGQLAAEYSARAEPDGYTVFNGANPIFTTARAIRGDKIRVTADDFVAIGSYTVDPTILVVRKDAPYKTMDELIAYAKANPGKLSAGDGGAGGAGHFTIEAIKLIFGIDIAAVHFQGAGTLIQQVQGRHIEIAVAGTSSFLPGIKSDQFTALALSSKHPDLPQVPTFGELKAADAAFDAWQGFFVPKATPPKMVERLSSGLAKVMNIAEVKQTVRKAGLLPRYVDGSGTNAMLDREYQWAVRIAKTLGLDTK